MIANAVIWGLLLGLGSSLHCAGMCGPIGCMLLSAASETPGRPALSRLIVMQTGRVLSYGLLGLAFGAFGAGLYGRLDLAGAHLALQWMAALIVIWMGLATAGLVPHVAAVDRMMAPVAGLTARVRMGLGQGGPEIDLVSGFVWGLTPCAMVYMAVFNSLILGSPTAGTVMMLAFGLGTAVPVVASSWALYRAAQRGAQSNRLLAGTLLIGAGLLAFLLTAPFSPFCITAA